MTVQPTNPCPTRRGFLAGAGVLGAMMLAGCTNKGAVSGSAAGSGAGTGANARTVRMGTMMTEDFLPGWVAAKEQMFPRKRQRGGHRVPKRSGAFRRRDRR